MSLLWMSLPSLLTSSMSDSRRAFSTNSRSSSIVLFLISCFSLFRLRIKSKGTAQQSGIGCHRDELHVA